MNAGSFQLSRMYGVSIGSGLELSYPIWDNSSENTCTCYVLQMNKFGLRKQISKLMTLPRPFKLLDLAQR